MGRLAPALLLSILFSSPGCASIAPAQARASEAQWTRFRLNERNDATLPGRLRASWRLETGGGFSSSPAIVGQTIFIGNNAGDIFALDLASGRVRWRSHQAAPVMSNPLVYDGMVIAGVGDRVWYSGDNQHPAMVGAGENALVALDRNTGALRWHLKLLGSAMPTPAIVDGKLIHHNGSGDIVAADPLSGTVLAESNAHNVAAMSAILPVAGGRFVTAGIFPAAVQELEASSLQPVWITQFTPRGAGIGDCPPASDRQLIFCDYVAPPDTSSELRIGGPAAQRVYALDETSGALVWETPLETGILQKYNASAIPLVWQGRVFVGSAVAPYVHALDTANGAVVWRVRVRGRVRGGIARSGDMLYFGDAGGYLWAVDARDGRIVGARNAHTIFNVGSPVIVGETLIVGTKTGAVIAMPLEEIRSSRDAK